mgnify:CR=1 FL=1
MMNWSGCADLNRGPHGPKPCALPTAPHPVTAFFSLMHDYYNMAPAPCQGVTARARQQHFSSLMTTAGLAIIAPAVAPFQYEEIPARDDAPEGIKAQLRDIAIARI